MKLRNLVSIWRILGLGLVLISSMPVGGFAQSDPPESRSFWQIILNYPSDCGGYIQRLDLDKDAGIRVFKQSEDRFIVLVTCDIHAYQQTDLAYWVERDGDGLDGTLMLFQSLEDLGQPIGKALTAKSGLIGWAAISGDATLRLHYKGRGLGDCGEAVTWDVSKPVPRVISYRAKPECDGQGANPDIWPPVDPEILNSYEPNRRDLETAKILAGLEAKWPGTTWHTHSILKADGTCNGKPEYWVAGVSRDGAFGLTMSQGTDIRHWPITANSEHQYAVCFPFTRISTEPPPEGLPEDFSHPRNCPAIRLDDEMCDSLKFIWDTENDRPALWRN